MPDIARRVKKQAAPAAAFLLGWGALYLITGELCWVQAVFGLPCPGCGTTRALLSLLHGDLAGALRWHPLILVTVTLLPAALLFSIFAKAGAQRRAANAALLLLLFAYLTVYAARMLVLFPHTPPMLSSGHAVWRQLLGFMSGL